MYFFFSIFFLLFLFFFNDTATTEIYTLSLHDALPISLSNFEFFKTIHFVNIDQKITSLIEDLQSILNPPRSSIVPSQSPSQLPLGEIVIVEYFPQESSRTPNFGETSDQSSVNPSNNLTAEEKRLKRNARRRELRAEKKAKASQMQSEKDLAQTPSVHETSLDETGDPVDFLRPLKELINSQARDRKSVV